MATYLFSENRELKNIQDGDVVVNDCDSNGTFWDNSILAAIYNKMQCEFGMKHINGVSFYTAHFTRIQADTEPQSAPNTPVPMGSN